MSLTTNNENNAHVSGKEEKNLRDLSPDIAAAIKHYRIKRAYNRITSLVRRELKAEFKDDAYQHIMEEIMHPRPSTKKSASFSQKNSSPHTKDGTCVLLSKTREEGNLSVFEGSFSISDQPTTITAKMTKAQIDFLDGKPMPKGRNLSR